MDIEDIIEGFDKGAFALLIPLGLLAGAILVRWARRRYQQLAAQYGLVASSCGLTGEHAARQLLTACGLDDVAVVCTTGRDLYQPKHREVQLAPTNYAGRSLAALATAAHEAGHAQQYAANRYVHRMRLGCRRLCQTLAITALLILLAATVLPVRNLGMALFALTALAVALQAAVTLPLERDASRRAGELLRKEGLIAPGEQAGFDLLLKTAWLTYAAVEARRGLGLLLIGVLIVAWPLAPGGFESPAVAYQSLGKNATSLPLHAMLIATARLIPLFVVALIFMQRVASARRRQPSPAHRAAGWHNVAMASFTKRDFAAAVRHLDQVIALQPGLAVAYFNRGSAYAGMRQWDRALADFDRALSLSPDLSGVFRLRGNMWLEKRDLDRALADFDAAIQHVPTDSAAWRDRGLTLLWRGDYDRALTDLDEAIRLNATDAVAFNNRGVVRIKRGESELASADLREAIRLDPALPNPRQHLAKLEATCLPG